MNCSVYTDPSEVAEVVDRLLALQVDCWTLAAVATFSCPCRSSFSFCLRANALMQVSAPSSSCCLYRFASFGILPVWLPFSPCRLIRSSVCPFPLA